ncbi:class III lanthionine synthetase LanKC [Streptomyces sp. NBC_00885]|uniref:class III lanthionine synthetase LanKC n=1 Tax=Streptomyces sp. NBC_00885 TaxID=2975857 RepID=UPI00386B844C|nr:class III lanthionine synthetase LanKC [Streptomyces sp. NBC_00885]
MDKRYEVFCLADRYFYETPDRLSAVRGPSRGAEQGEAGESVPLFEAARRPVPEGWRRFLSGDWLHISPVGTARPRQGWKIHVSATLDNAEKTAARVWDYCVPRSVPFKFVPGRQPLHLRNSKYAGRGSSGKFATIYPADESELRLILDELGQELAGEPGPYILTDLRWMQGPLYVRYGGFAKRHCVDEAGSGALVPAIENPEGVLVPDRRDPVFQLPEWVTLPAFLEPQLAARNATTTQDLPYRIERALHFSNGGGVYAGTDLRTGEQVVLKEARPHAGLAADGADAVTRLERERAALERLGGLGVAPEARDWFTLGDHRFLVMDFLPGRTLNSFFAERHPLLAVEPDPAAVADYTRWALGVLQAVEEAVAAVHGRGLVFNDLHMFNIMVDPDDDSVRLLDFEAATPVEEHRGQAMAHPGFVAPGDRVGFEVDRYALACLRLALFVPMTTLLVVDRHKAAHLAEVAGELFPDLPDGFLAEAVEVVRGGRQQGQRQGQRQEQPVAGGGACASAPRDRYLPVPVQDWPASRDSMVRAILASATPEREDRLFPGDIAQFGDGGGLGLAHGVAGVLYALAETGAERYEAGEEWLLSHTDPPPSGTPFGLYDGLAGVADVLDRLGHRERAVELVGRVMDEKWQRLAPDLHGGLAGIGLVLDRLGLRAQALEAASVLIDRPQPPGRGRRAGLLRGASGPALFFLRLYESTGDPALVDEAARALRRDLAACVRDRTGTLLVDEGARTMPYLGAGSTGIGAVLDDFLAHRHDEEFARAREAILPAARLRYYAQPGLFNGRAGMVLHLARTRAPRPHLDAQIAALDWYAVPYRGELAFPGDQMMRLSMDLATGTAGVLLALGTALGHSERPARLPFLPPPKAAPRTTP